MHIIDFKHSSVNINLVVYKFIIIVNWNGDNVCLCVKVYLEHLPKSMAHGTALISFQKTLNAMHVGPVYCVACQFDLQYSLLLISHCHLVSEGGINLGVPASIEPATFGSPCQCCYYAANSRLYIYIDIYVYLYKYRYDYIDIYVYLYNLSVE